MVAAPSGEVYSPDEVPQGINMAPEAWRALGDRQRQMVGDRRFARAAVGPDDELATYEVVLPPNVVMDAGSGRASHWLMARDRVLQLQAAHREIWVMKDLWLPADYGDAGDGWWGVNMHNSAKDVGNTGSGGVGWGFGNGVSALAWALVKAPLVEGKPGDRFCVHVEQFDDVSNGGNAKNFPVGVWPRGRWVSVLQWVRFGRGDVPGMQPGAMKVWADGQLVLDVPKVTNLQKARNPADGKTYVQTIGEWWEGGPYRLQAGGGAAYRSRQTLSRIGATLRACYDDRPVLAQEWASVYPAPGTQGGPPSYSQRLSGADARRVRDFVLPQFALDELGLAKPPDPPVDPPDPPVDEGLQLRVAALERQMAGLGDAAAAMGGTPKTFAGRVRAALGLVPGP
jgi:hypothetical protein